MRSKVSKWIFMISALLLIPCLAFAEGGIAGPSIRGIRIEFFLFGLTLLGVALFHKQTFWVAIAGLTSIVLYKLFFITGYPFAEHFLGSNTFAEQFMDKSLRQGEWGILVNLFGLLLGFSLLAKIFEESGVPDILPKYLPNDWKGPFVLLVFVFVISSFLDNIAAAMIGGSIALVVFKNRVHIGYIAAIVAASNAGGSGSVVGDTTTTMMWIDGVSAFNVFHGFIAAGVALLIVAWFASHQQDRHQPITADAKPGAKVDWVRLGIVLMILIGAILSNVYYDMPALGVWIAILIGAFLIKMPWNEVPASLKGSIFLLCLVTSASFMPVETLPDASWMTAFILGFVSAVFDNIPLTKLCLEQGHFDWGMLAYSVGFGGSMIWFGSSAGVAITNKFPESRDVLLWIRKGWHVTFAYIVGFFVLFLVMGWEPASNKKHQEPPQTCTAPNCPVKIKADAMENAKKHEIKP
ncbi:MAG TPA: SLC13 family permease [Prolixibacteraceae bacterium]|jgi:Na+/H+ antiporter NhaD/arsenite permease-like protein